MSTAIIIKPGAYLINGHTRIIAMSMVDAIQTFSAMPFSVPSTVAYEGEVTISPSAAAYQDVETAARQRMLARQAASVPPADAREATKAIRAYEAHEAVHSGAYDQFTKGQTLVPIEVQNGQARSDADIECGGAFDKYGRRQIGQPLELDPESPRGSDF